MHRARSARRGGLGRTLRCGLFLVLPHRAFSLVPVVPPPSSVGSVGASLPEVWTAYESALAVYPLETKVATAAVLAVAGDAIAQRRGGDKYDATRACSFVLFDAAYRGGFQHAAFPWIIEHCQGDVLGRVVSSSAVDPNLLAAIECTAFNQLLVVPIVYYPLFFGITGAVQGLSLSESLTRAREQFVDLTLRNWKFWIPAQLVQFYLLPIDLQVTAPPWAPCAYPYPYPAPTPTPTLPQHLPLPCPNTYRYPAPTPTPTRALTLTLTRTLASTVSALRACPHPVQIPHPLF